LQGYTSEMQRAGVNYFLSRKAVLEFIESLTAVAFKQIDALLQEAVPNVELIKTIKRTLYLAAQVAGQMKALQVFNPNVQGFEWYKHLLNLKFSKDLARRVGDGGSISEQVNEEMADRVLLESHMSLPALMVRISGASQIEPWLLIVERVRLDESVSVRNVYLRNEGLASSKGPNGYFLVPSEESLTDSEKILLSYLFTGSPFLYLPSQPAALVSILWVRALEELLIAFRRRRFDRQKLIGVAKAALKLTHPVSFKARLPGRLGKLLAEARVDESDWRAAIVSEREGVFSLCIALVALAQNLQLLQSDDRFYHTVAMCLLQESVSRAAKAYCRSQGSNFSRTDHLASILGISATCASDGRVMISTKECVERTRKFFKLRNTNCTPFAVVATLGFLVSGAAAAADDGAESLFALYENSTISMKTFIKSLNEHVDPLQVQLALFLNAFLWDEGGGAVDHRAAFQDPQKVIDSHAATIINTLKRRADTLKQKQTISRARFVCKLKAFEAHAKYHEGDPVILRHSHIATMNMSRPADNQLELADGFTEFGLLKYHCCYPGCPEFLGKSFRSRKQLFQHLDPDQKYYINFVPAYHLTVHAIFKQHRVDSAEKFRHLMRKAISRDGRMSKWFALCPEANSADSGLDALYEQFRQLFENNKISA
jgi:hypothetical protein